MINPRDIIQGINEGLKLGTFQGKVIVVGAGVAGLTATQVLRQSGVEVQLLEASSNYGGRIASLNHFTDIPIELGAEWVHGQSNVWYELLKNVGYTLEQENQEDYYFLGDELVSEAEAEKRKIYQEAITIFEEIESYEGEAISARDFISNMSHSAQVSALINAWLGNEYGSDNANICLQALAKANEYWEEDTVNYRLVGTSFYDTLSSLFPKALDVLRLNTPINSIDYEGENVILKSELGEVFEAERIILTLPLSILKFQQPTFTPPLPEPKQIAIEQLGMGKGFKLFLKFSWRFWQEDLGTIYGVGLVPEYYILPSNHEAILVCFVMGEKASFIEQKGENKALELILEELGQIFKQSVGPLLLAHRWQNWGSADFIRGTYSYPSVNNQKYRQDLQHSIEKKVFFAGEAYHRQGYSATVQGAIETAFRAAEQVIRL